jgi:hypothetical protein
MVITSAIHTHARELQLVSFCAFWSSLNYFIAGFVKRYYFFRFSNFPFRFRKNYLPIFRFWKNNVSLFRLASIFLFRRRFCNTQAGLDLSSGSSAEIFEP